MSSKFIVALAFLGMTILVLPGGPAAAQISLGTAQNFGVLGGSTVTNTGATTVTGDVGVSPGTAVTGFPPGLVVGGSIHNNDAVAVQAQSDLTIAYNAIATTPCTVDLTGQNLGGLTLTPGVYCFSSSAQLTGALTLDALGNPDALFLFKIGSTLTTSSGASVTVINGGTSCNQVYWQVGSSATIGTGSLFAGDILALTSITLTTGAETSGRVLARNGAVTLDTNDVNACGPVVACAVITVDPPTLPNGTVGVGYNQVVSASGGTSPYTFAVSTGALPTGLSLNPTTGAISGTPTAVGSFDFTITATDANGCPGSRLYTVTIAGPGCPVITLSAIALPPGRVGQSYSQTISASGGTGPYTFSITSGALPAGLTLGATTGLISGVPQVTGLSSFTVQATDSGGCTGARPYTVTILAAIVPSAIPTADPLMLLVMAALLGGLGVFFVRRFTM